MRVLVYCSVESVPDIGHNLYHIDSLSLRTSSVYIVLNTYKFAHQNRTHSRQISLLFGCDVD